MGDRIVEQGQGYVIALSDEATTSVPYVSSDRQDGDRNYGFVDLRDQPDLVEQIPEAKKSEGLADLLRAINSKNSLLMSIGCECGLFYQEVGQDGDPNCYIGSYVDITYRNSDTIRDSQPLIDLARLLLDQVRLDTPLLIRFDMIVEPIRHFFGQPNRFALQLRPIGFGQSEPEAWEAFDLATFALAMAVRRFHEQNM